MADLVELYRYPIDFPLKNIGYILIYTMFIHRVIKALVKEDVKYAIAGGWAVAFHGAVRGTVDLDIVIKLTENNFRHAVKAMGALGLESRLPVTVDEVIQFREEYVKNRNMKAWRFMNPKNPAEIVDILLIEDLRNLKVKKVPIGKDEIPIVSLEDLIRMKRNSGRPQDLEDIKALEMLEE